MTSVSSAEREVCAFQGRVFELSARELEACGSAVFIRRFMRSDVAWRVDVSGSFEGGATERTVIWAVDAEYEGAPYGSEVYPTEVLYWMGYTYRYWCVSMGVSSKRAYAICGAREMRDLYLAYHALDPAQCVERILEAKGLPVDEETDVELTRRAVQALRRIRAR